MSETVRKTVLKESLEEGPESDPENEAQQEQMPLKYIFLTIFSCFCPSYPINIVAFVLSMMALHSYNEGNIDGAKKLSHIAMLVAIAAIIVGLLIIAISCIVHFTVQH
ncbi:transmembrane protein 233 isoform X1 [Scyliorhinus canicula]|uniref:transmembrane protein 233 isoform X1 n=1 Tax=Scyliorhinus canicula TaxID=7830 RepID=UPI0018F70103|nr:transmembrane protein 233 isoform X1 [Scyliorhinus canicula]